jgi:hypothetical protein
VPSRRSRCARGARERGGRSSRWAESRGLDVRRAPSPGPAGGRARRGPPGGVVQRRTPVFLGVLCPGDVTPDKPPLPPLALCGIGISRRPRASGGPPTRRRGGRGDDWARKRTEAGRVPRGARAAREGRGSAADAQAGGRNRAAWTSVAPPRQARPKAGRAAGRPAGSCNEGRPSSSESLPRRCHARQASPSSPGSVWNRDQPEAAGQWRGADPAEGR